MDHGQDFCIDCWRNISSERTKPKYFAVFDRESITQVLDGKKKAEMIVKHCHALMYDAIHERIEDLLDELNIAPGRRRDQGNEHKLKVGNRLRVHGVHNGYCVRVTPKFVFYVTKPETLQVSSVYS